MHVDSLSHIPYSSFGLNSGKFTAAAQDAGQGTGAGVGGNTTGPREKDARARNRVNGTQGVEPAGAAPVNNTTTGTHSTV